MFRRELTFPEKRSFFLFGARGTGKSTLVGHRFPPESTWFVDLLLASREEAYARDPDLFYREVKQLPDSIDTVVIDEVQKQPKLLDLVHKLIFETERRFVMTGSSARKLRHGAANLLAGRAFERRLYPLTCRELGERFDLEEILAWGSLPEQFALSLEERGEYLRAYARSYLKEEVWGEHLIRKLEPFRKFLEVAAQHNGQPVNFESIGRDVGVDGKTVREYYQILEDTLLGHVLEPYLRSERKRVQKAPKFYLFDVGVARALANLLTVRPAPQTSYYGDLFEQFVILEFQRREAYQTKDYRFYYLATERVQVDLIIERPGRPLAAVEIKSTDDVRPDKLRGLNSLRSALPEAELYCLSRDPRPQRVGEVEALPWQEGLESL
jgi:predicted AAA+ superfamily ATPase